MARDDGTRERSGRGAHAAPRSAGSGVLAGVVLVLVLLGVVLTASQCGGTTAAAPTSGPPSGPPPAAGAVPGPAPGSAPVPAPLPADPVSVDRLRLATQATPLEFDGNGMAMRPGADVALERIAAAAREAPGVAITVTGHTAPVDGDPAWCQQLSQMRADMVADRLRAAGVAPDRLHTVGVSHSHPAPTWAASRRVEVAPG